MSGQESEGAKLLREALERALAPLEALHAEFAKLEPGVILTCHGRPPLIRFRTCEYGPTPLSQVKATLASIGHAHMLKDAHGRRLAPWEIVERFGVPIEAAEYARLALHRVRT